MSCRNHAVAWFTGSSDDLWLNVIHANFGFLTPMMPDSQIVAIEFGHQNPGLAPKCTRNPGEKSVVIRILLFKNIKELVAGKIDALMPRVISCIVHNAHGMK